MSWWKLWRKKTVETSDTTWEANANGKLHKLGVPSEVNSSPSIVALEISGLRGFSTAEYLPVAVPNGQTGSGLTILVGPNNAGKSTITEAFSLFMRKDPPQFSEGKRNKIANEHIEIRLITSAGTWQQIQTQNVGTSTANWSTSSGTDDTVSIPNILVLPSRRRLETFFRDRDKTERAAYTKQYGLPTFRSPNNYSFHGRLFRAQEHKAEFNAVFEKVIDNVPDWSIDLAEGGEFYLKFRYGPLSHNSEGLGEGLVSLWFIIDALYDSQPNDVIVLDEPELSLHPALQKRLFALFAEYAKDRQIVYATHSPYLIRWPAVVQGAQIVRVHKYEHRTVISALRRETIRRISGLIGNRNNPHILGLDAREVFFLDDHVILVEGPDDVICYQEIAEQIGRTVPGSLYGWGVGGASNMPIIAQMLADLGFRRVVGILDSNQENLRGQLMQDFPQYQWFTIPANDVRTKKAAKPQPQVEGLLDPQGVLRKEYREAVEQLFSELEVALNNRVE